MSDNSDDDLEPTNSESTSSTIQTTDVPADIAQSKAQSPVQPILGSYPRTMFGKRKNARNRITGIKFFRLLSTQLLEMLCFVFLAISSPFHLHLPSKCL